MTSGTTVKPSATWSGARATGQSRSRSLTMRPPTDRFSSCASAFSRRRASNRRTGRRQTRSNLARCSKLSARLSMKSTSNGVSSMWLAYSRQPRQLQDHDVGARASFDTTIEIGMVEEPGLEWLTADRGAEKSDERVAVAPSRVPLDPKGQIRRGPPRRRRSGTSRLTVCPARPARSRIPANWSAEHLIATAWRPRRARRHDQHAHTYSVTRRVRHRPTSVSASENRSTR